MPTLSSVWTMIGLDLLMLVYTLWVLAQSQRRKVIRAVGLGMLGWLGALHLLLSKQMLYSNDITGFMFLVIIFVGVGLVGGLLFLVTPLRALLLDLDQRQLLLLQGIRIFFGAGFLVQAALGWLPLGFGVVDGLTHIGAGFFGLLAAFAVSGQLEGKRRAWFANIFGIVDILVVAGTLSLILLPQISPYHNMMYAVFFPAPLWLWFHIVAMWKLCDERASGRKYVPVPQA